MPTNNSCNYSPTQHAVQVGGLNGSITSIAVGASNSVLQGSTGADPSFTTTPQIVGLGIGAASTGSGLTFDGSNTLANYSVGTWTPTLSFSGASVGVTYSTQQGNYTRIGNTIFFHINLVLTSKGSSTGECRITLPFMQWANAAPRFMAQLQNVTFTLKFVDAQTQASTQYVRFVQTNNINAGNTALSDTAIANNSSFILSGYYFV